MKRMRANLLHFSRSTRQIATLRLSPAAGSAWKFQNSYWKREAKWEQAAITLHTWRNLDTQWTLGAGLNIAQQPPL